MDLIGEIRPLQSVTIESEHDAARFIVVIARAIAPLLSKLGMSFGGPIVLGLAIGVLKDHNEISTLK